MAIKENTNLREKYCNRIDLIDSIEFYIESIIKKEKKIEQIEEDIINNIKRFPKDNNVIIYDTKKRVYQHIRTSLNAMYSLGCDCDSMEELYVLGIKYISEISKDLIIIYQGMR